MRPASGSPQTRASGVQLAELTGWHSSKVSKIESGKQTPAEADIRTLLEQAVVGEAARGLIGKAMGRRRPRSEGEV
ncbi:helix-turn-helix domain-containing protein [Nocardia alni]|uniref:helix-turn-helix domain-containing protein n=1 Tax=Nocardia alni TaxID=2815723 RepID=UPI001C24688F|nr:helix-turn-helix transcriptional regulator [Nocardia alni]